MHGLHLGGVSRLLPLSPHGRETPRAACCARCSLCYLRRGCPWAFASIMTHITRSISLQYQLPPCMRPARPPACGGPSMCDCVPWPWGGRVGCRPSVRKKPPSGVHPAPWYLKQVACEVFTFYMMNIIQSTSSRYPIPPWTPSAAGADRWRQKPVLVDPRTWCGTWAAGPIHFPAPCVPEGLRSSTEQPPRLQSQRSPMSVLPAVPSEWDTCPLPALPRPRQGCLGRVWGHWEGEVQEHLQGTTEAFGIRSWSREAPSGWGWHSLWASPVGLLLGPGLVPAPPPVRENVLRDIWLSPHCPGPPCGSPIPTLSSSRVTCSKAPAWPAPFPATSLMRVLRLGLSISFRS